MLPRKPRIPIRDILLYGLWPNRIKLLLYRMRGHKIGKDVSIGLGAVILGDKISIGEGTSISFFTVIRGTNITIGPFVNIGALTFIDTPHVEIGEGSRINEQVFIGGLQEPESRFIMGRNCLIMQLAFLNPSPSITIGDDTGIGGHALVFGHWSWLNQLDGYTVEYEPIEIGNSVSLAWRVFVAPGTKIGDGTVVGANSLVKGDIPAYSMVAGYPARVISKALEFPKKLSADERTALYRNMISELLRCFKGWGLTCEADGSMYRFTSTVDTWWSRKTVTKVLATTEELPTQAWVDSLRGVDVALSLLEIPVALRERLTDMRVMWIDVAKKEQSRKTNELGDEVTLFLKRFGIRTLRWPVER